MLTILGTFLFQMVTFYFKIIINQVTIANRRGNKKKKHGKGRSLGYMLECTKKSAALFGEF